VRRSAVDLVRHLTAVQAQLLPAAGLALRARTEGLTAERVDRARLHDRSIVLTWALRGTLHLVTAEDHGWLVPLVIAPRIPHAHRRLKQEKVSTGQADTAVTLIGRMLGRDGALTRPEIAERLRRRGIPTQGQAIAHLVWLATARGLICHGPDRGGKTCFVLVRDWLDRPSPMDRADALVELAVRYLAAHGPAEPADLAAWSGIRTGEARRAWGAIGDRLADVETIRGRRWILRSQREEIPRGLVRLLPSFDEYLLGWKDRDLVGTAERWKNINRGGGWLNPVLLADGRAIGTWGIHREPQGVRLEIRSFSSLTPSIRRRAMVEASDVGAFLRAHVEATFA
jgi:hypothetical protein